MSRNGNEGVDLVRHVARVTIEFTSPFLVGSGEGDLVADAVPVCDANGLPLLPGTSLGGVLRAAWEAAHGTEAAAALFGDGGSRGDGERDSRGSRLWVSWGHIHDQNDLPVDGCSVASGEAGGDPVLALAMSMTIRDHVRLNHRGVAADRGKFDQAVVSAGHRFTFQIEVEGGDGGELPQLLGLLCGGALRLGRGGRRALGAFKAIALKQGRFDLRDSRDRAAYLALPVSLRHQPKGLEEYRSPAMQSRVLELELTPLECWSFGGAEAWAPPALSSRRNTEKLPDLVPLQDVRIVWDGGRGRAAPPEMVLPGTGWKGAIAHRVAFHANALRGCLADKAPIAKDCLGSGNPVVAELFGTEDADGRGRNARRGRVAIDDVWATQHGNRLLPIMHNSQDRFTGGTLPGALFEELVIDRGPVVRLTIQVDGWPRLTDGARESLRRALRDLCRGRLQVGSGAGRGHGYFEDREFDRKWKAFQEIVK